MTESDNPPSEARPWETEPLVTERLESVFEPPLPNRPGDRRRWARLYGSGKGLAIAAAVRRHRGPCLVIVPNAAEAGRIADEVRFFGGDGLEPLAFPDWETLPYDRFSPYQDIVSERLATLYRLPELPGGIVIAAVTTLMQRLPPRSFLEGNTLLLRTGERVDRDALCERLIRGGYRAVSQVIEHGDYALRGSIMDVFPMGSPSPYRIDWLDDEIDSLRTFDPESQRSTGTVPEIRVLPAREFPLTPTAIERFRGNWRARFEGSPQGSPLYRDVSQGLCPPGIEYYLPLFFEETATLFDYLPADTLILVDTGVEEAAERFHGEVRERHESLRHDRERPLCTPAEVFFLPNEVFAAVKAHPSIMLLGPLAERTDGVSVLATLPPPTLPIGAHAADPLGLVKRFLATYEGRVLFVAESKGRRETLSELFRQHAIPFVLFADFPAFLTGDARIGLTVAPLQRGVRIEDRRIAIVCESELFPEHAPQARRQSRAARDPEGLIRDLSELSQGAPVVHEHHGVGRYLGLFLLDAGGTRGEYLGIEYADGDKLYVPVLALHLITRYTGAEGEHAPLHKLGSSQWQKARARAAQRIRDVAAELLEVYAKRSARTGHAYGIDEDAYQSFAQGFPFEETPDQAAAITAVLGDLRAEQPTDRLVCGDVGFGKTEVAMRAAFVAAMDGKQVAILVPTTLLAQQHFENFKDRFADWPVRIEFLSRFQNKREQDRITTGLKTGAVDIVIGTHKLLQEDVSFKRLGLLVIDEEHRFGVRQKERLKALRSEVDIVTLTATPIPRTLNLALSAARELSIIATPPARRLAVKTFVNEWDDHLLREAMVREIARGGQVYFLHNEVETIENIAKKIETLLPEGRVRIAHGQMRERELEHVMLDFYHQRFNCLVCTTIIESGIDVPNANTIIMNRADKLGLAQLYQLRGRVGRSHHRAYAYLVIPPRQVLGADAVKRLEAIASIEELGVGFTLATHDLEIRGAGEILGEEQSGHIQEIGFGLYSELLQRAVADLKSGREPLLDRPLDHGTEIELHTACLIPEDYLPDVHTRLILYKRIASAADDAALTLIMEEMADRFGRLPAPAKDLCRVTRLKLRAAPLGVKRVDLGPRGGRIVFHPEAPIDPLSVVRLVQSQPARYRFEANERLRITADLPEGEQRMDALDALFDRLAGRDNDAGRITRPG
ncbi:MAG: transcription-repair coupling factor [Gammaproteobacteria bacterium]|nr:transcription-repair coupling factor [Gammaproteobacteria bacterium]